MTEYDFVGVDIAKDKFDVAVCVNGHDKLLVFTNNPKGYKAFFEWMAKHLSLPWVCMEATGHYSLGLADYLTAHTIDTSVVNPFQIKNFAKASLARNKTDALDAKIIARFGQCMRPPLYQTISVEKKEVKEFIKVLDMLKEQRTQLNNQLHSIQGKAARKVLETMVKRLEKEIEQIEQKIAELIAENQSMQETFQLLTSIKGVGPLTAYRVIALMPHINSFATAKQFAAFIGITPKQHQSGTLIGKTTLSKLGDSRLRKALYMAALVAKRFNPNLVTFVKRLETKGKTPKTIVCAVMRKLAHIIFGVLKNKTPFNKHLTCF